MRDNNKITGPFFEREFPLAQAARLTARRLGFSLIIALCAGATAAGLFPLFMEPVFESRATATVDLHAVVSAFALQWTSALGASTPSALRETVNRQADALVQLMGNRILAKDQTVKQYVSSWRANALAARMASDTVIKALIARHGAALKAAWPEAEDLATLLRNKALRVERGAPESVITLIFAAPDGALAHDGLATVIEELMTLERQSRAERRLAILSDAQERIRKTSETISRLENRPSLSHTEVLTLDGAKKNFGQSMEIAERMGNPIHVLNRPEFRVEQEPQEATLISPRPIILGARFFLAFFLGSLFVMFLATPSSKEGKS